MTRIRSILIFMIFTLVTVSATRPAVSGLIQTTPSRAPRDPIICNYLAIDAKTRPDQRFKVWVFFTDKGTTDNAEIDLLIQNGIKRILPKTLERREKTTGERPYSGLFDIDVSAEYVDAVLAKGATHRTTSRWLNAVSVEASAREIIRISELPFIYSIRPVAGFVREEFPPKLSLRQRETSPLSESFGIDYGNSFLQSMLITVPPLHELGYTGDGVLVGVLDTGFRKDHMAITGLDIIAEHDFVFDDDDTQYDPSDPDDYSDFHGTGVLSILAGNAAGELVGPAFGASFLLGKTEDIRSETPIEEDYWVEGIEWMELSAVDIVSSSLGYTRFDDDSGYEFSDLDGNTAVTTIAADFAANLGVFVVNAAGNDRNGEWGHIITPADGDSVAAVGAVDGNRVLASFSSPGPTFDGRTKPDVCAMGSGNYFALNIDTLSYANGSGTSFATPMVAGASALLLEAHPEWTAMDVLSNLRATASQSSTPDNDLGWGIINTLRAADLDVPFVLLVSTAVDDDSIGESLGNGNGFPEAGETIELAVFVSNIGDTSTSGVEAVLRTEDQYVSLLDSTETFTDLAPDDSTFSDDDFDFVLGDSLPLAHSVLFTLLITDDELREWQYTFTLSTGQLFLVSGDVLSTDMIPLPNSTLLVFGPLDSLGQFETITVDTTDDSGHFGHYQLPGRYSYQALQEGYLLSHGYRVDLPPDTSLSIILVSPQLSLDTDADTLIIPLDVDLKGSSTFTVTNTGTGALFFSLQEVNPLRAEVSHSAIKRKDDAAALLKQMLEQSGFRDILKGGSISPSSSGQVPVTAADPVDSLWNIIYPDNQQRTDMDIWALSSQIDRETGMLYLRLAGYEPWGEVPGVWWAVFVLDTDSDPSTGDPVFGTEYMLLRIPEIGSYAYYWDEGTQDYEILGPLPYEAIGDSTFDIGVSIDMIDDFTGPDPELMDIAAGFLWPEDPDTARLGDVVPADGAAGIISLSLHDDEWLVVEPAWKFLMPGESAEVSVHVDMQLPLPDTVVSSILFNFNEPRSEPFLLWITPLFPEDIGEEFEKGAVPIAYSLSQNYPNPFNPVTRIQYDVPNSISGEMKVLIRIYDMRGRLIRTLLDEEKEPGSYSVVWDGKDERGEPVSSGVYLYRMESGRFSSLKKMIMIK